MEFNPNNHIVKYCLQGMALEEKGEMDKASSLFMQAWNEAANDHEKFIAAYYVARHQKNIPDKLKWLNTALQLALKINDDSVNAALASLYLSIAECYEEMNEPENAKKNIDLANSAAHKPTDKGPFYHGTKADLQAGDHLMPGYGSNYQSDLTMNHIYFTAILNGAGLAAALAKGDSPERVYIVEPTGDFENDPNVTNKKFPGNPTRSYRTTSPLKIVGEATDWVRITPEQLQQWREKLANTKGEIIN
ncbi:MAG: NAD(+)--rifampin ADP-ribosyltransferase [Chitinophagaceae bacterium]|nr:NAD(+)--rifampin ADP-ribosyltransferase [Chitinophagaceae bacterium]